MSLEAWAIVVVVVVPRAIDADGRRDQEKVETSKGTGNDRRQQPDTTSQTPFDKKKIWRSGARSEDVEEGGAFVYDG